GPVKPDPGDLVGRAVLAEPAPPGVQRRLVGLEVREPRIPRHGYPVRREGPAVGPVTSGTRLPTLGTYIGLAYVTADAAAPGTPVAVEIRGRRVPARVVARPFYRRMRREEGAWRSRTTSATRRSTSGCARGATTAWLASRTSRRTRSA